MLNVPIQEMMESKVITISEDASIAEAAEKMRSNGIRHLPVIARSGQLTGLFTQRDLYRILPSRLNEDDPIDTKPLKQYVLRDVMRRIPETLGPKDPVPKAVSLMGDKKYGCVPIVDSERKVIGIITAIDILHFAVHFLK